MSDLSAQTAPATTEASPAVPDPAARSVSDPVTSAPRLPSPNDGGPSLTIPRLSTGAFLTILLTIGALLHQAAIRTGFLLDDFLHIAMLEGNFPVDRHPLDLYAFVDDHDRDTLLAHGVVPWWTHPHLTIRFLRPVSSATIWLDHALFGRNALAMHVHSLLWWAAMVVLAFFLYRRLLGERVARLAAFVFALAPCHAMPMAWLANRDALISLTLGLVAFHAYVRARETGRAAALLGATLLFSVALSAGEYTLLFTAFVLGFELVRKGDSLARRLVGLGTFGVPCAVYMGIRSALHYGAAGSGFYNDPFTAPELFLWFAPRRLATLFLDAWLSLDNDSVRWSIPSWALGLAMLAVILGVGGVLRHQLRDEEEKGETRRVAAFFAVAMFLAFIPVLSAVPSPRLLGGVMLAVAPLVGLVLERAWFPARPQPRRGWPEAAQLTALCLGFAHLVHGPGTMALLDEQFRTSGETFQRQIESLRAMGDLVHGPGAVVVRGSGTGFFVPFAIAEDGELPDHFSMLTWTSEALVLRTGPRTLQIYSDAESALFPWAEGNLYNEAGWMTQVGDRFPAPGMVVTVTDVVDGRVTGASVELDEVGLSRLWLNETGKSYFASPLPAEGEGRMYQRDD